MFHTENTVTLLATIAATISAFGALYCLTQDRDKLVFRLLAFFLIASTMAELGTVLNPILISPYAKAIVRSLWIVGAASVTPLFWLYVWTLTAENQQLPKRLIWHFALPLLYAFAAIIIAIMMIDGAIPILDEAAVRNQILSGNYEGLMFPIPFQWAFYFALTARRLVQYHARLKDVFASTEKKEMQWVSFVMASYGVYWILQTGSVIFEMVTDRPGVPVVVEYAFNIVIVTTITLWGLRQRPGIVPHQAEKSPAPSYEKSALDEEAKVRIAKKLRRAMQADKLYLNANLSLWILARHVRVGDNYVSQVLNEKIGENFFDFVNGYRIRDAQDRLKDSSETILTIAYDVGFNSRSSFYTAFKKVTNMTPTAFRKAQIHSEQISLS
jgi:AraC-like DNA-binding protein